MRRIDGWLDRERRRRARQPRLVDALFGTRALGYVSYRLRYVTLRVLLRTILHVVEVVALSQVFAPRYLGPILVLRHATLLFSNFYWGILEAQRRGLRLAHQQRNPSGFADLRRRWQVNALVTVLLQQIAVGVALWLMPRRFVGFSIYDAYAIACGIRLGLDTWSRTCHSAVFAVARIRRPLWSMVLIDGVEVVGLLLTWLWIGAFAFALMLVVTGLLRASSTLWFSRQTSIQFGLAEPNPSLWKVLRRGAWHAVPYAEGLKYGSLNLALQIDSMAIVLLSSGIGGDDGILLSLSLSLHALSPLLGAGFGWARTFYFDFVHQLDRAPLLLVHRFGRLLDRVALGYPIVLGFLVLPLVNWLVPGLLATTEGLLGAVVVARSLFALRQMEAYSYADHRVQLRQAAILALVSAITLALSHHISSALAGIAAGLVLGALVGRRAQPKAALVTPGTLLCPEAFVAWIERSPLPLRLAQLQIDRRMTNIQKILRTLCGHGFDGPALQVGPAQLLLTIGSRSNERELRLRLITSTAGTLRSAIVSQEFETGARACQLLQTSVGLGATAALASGPDSAVGLGPVIAAGVASAARLEQLTLEFERRFSDGAWLSSERGNLGKIGAAAREGLPALLTELSHHTVHQRRSACPIEVAVYRPKGEAKQVFIVPANSPKAAEFREFRRHIIATSIRDSFGALPG